MQRSFRNDGKPGLSKNKQIVRAAKEELESDRRVQDACDTQRTALYGCLLDDTCNECYEDAIQTATAETVTSLCRESEILLCASHSTCTCGSGCESEAELLFQCGAAEVGCTNPFGCAYTACDLDIIAMVNCDSTLDAGCVNCVIDAHNTLFPTEDSTTGCNEIEDALCPSLESCGCGDCSDEVRGFWSCSYSNCSAFDCDNITACVDEQAAFYDCLPDERCVGCYEVSIDNAFQAHLCGEVELSLCSHVLVGQGVNLKQRSTSNAKWKTS